MEIRHRLYCGQCKSTEKLIRIAKNKYKTVQYYLCRTCNTEKARKYRSTEYGASRARIAVYKSIAKYPERHQARMILNNAVKTGRIIRPSICSRCSAETIVEAHHTDYTQPLNVVWLCRDCHTVV